MPSPRIDSTTHAYVAVTGALMLAIIVVCHAIAARADGIEAIQVQAHADCMTKLKNGNIKLHQCKRKRSVKPAPAPKRKILVVPTGREWGI